MSKFKVGDRVRIKPMNEISLDEDRHDRHTGVYFNDVMEDVAGNGKVYVVTDVIGDQRYKLSGNAWTWVDAWLDFATFTKADLKSGYLVEYRSGELRLVVETSDGGFVLLSGECMIYNSSSAYKDDLRYSCAELPNDIMRVYGLPKLEECGSVLSTFGRKLLWEREEKPAAKKMTVSDVCKALGYDVEIVKDGATDA